MAAIKGRGSSFGLANKMTAMPLRAGRLYELWINCDYF